MRSDISGAGDIWSKQLMPRFGSRTVTEADGREKTPGEMGGHDEEAGTPGVNAVTGKARSYSMSGEPDSSRAEMSHR